MTEEQFKELMKQLREMNRRLSTITNAISDVKEDTDTLRHCLTEKFGEEEEGKIWSMPAILDCICDNMP